MSGGQRSPAEIAAEWIRLGQQEEAGGRFGQALAAYDQALALLQSPDEGARDRRLLAVAWMNRGSVLTQMDGEDGLDAALEAYDEAIALKRACLAEYPDEAPSLASALMNRSQLLHRRHGLARAGDSLAASEAAERCVLDWMAAAPAAEAGTGDSGVAGGGGSAEMFDPAKPVAVAGRVLGAILVNRANLLLDLGRIEPALAAARASLARVDAMSAVDLMAGSIALMARRALADALGQALVMPGADQDAIATEAGDVVDDALALVRHWAARIGPERAFPGLAVRFVRFGGELYRRHQPWFLPEFLRESLSLRNGDAEIHAVVRELITAALAPGPTAPFLEHGTPAYDRRLQTIKELQALQEELDGEAEANLE